MPLTNSDAYINKYRPKRFEDVVGQDAAVRSLRKVIEKGTAKAFLLTGPAGTGKTTLARIISAGLGAQPEDVRDFDAATHTGVDDIRDIVGNLLYKPLGAGSVKAVIVDECHMLSKSAWNSLLKILEEPPAHVIWCLCTTEPVKVPKTVFTRCASYELRPVDRNILFDLLVTVAEAEKIFDGPEGDKVLNLIAKSADGSPRQALSYLATCEGAETYEQVKDLMRSAEENTEVIELVRALVRGAGWGEVKPILAGLAEVNPESARHQIRAYVTKVILGDGKGAGRYMPILEAFSEPFNSADGITPLVLACGRITLGERV